MRRLAIGAVTVLVLPVVLMVAAQLGIGASDPALGSQPPGQLGYEGQPGNQGGGQHHHAPGLLGYEGQPGNQGG